MGKHFRQRGRMSKSKEWMQGVPWEWSSSMIRLEHIARGVAGKQYLQERRSPTQQGLVLGFLAGHI
jgi:hypothetical protein